MNNPLQKHTDTNFSWKQTTVSPCETHHLNLIDNMAFYKNRFQNVLKFHDPGYAPVEDDMDSYHIDMAGNPIYPHRFLKTFGFYEGYAAVKSKVGWFHILPNGSPAYEDRYAWCGNFQEGLCPVRDQAGNYFHITKNGERLYTQNYRYVGDFKDAIAVVCREDGKSSHIDTQGNFIHPHWYLQLDVFHKGFARAKDEQGWFHIKKGKTTPDGLPIYLKRFSSLEPFYNGQAHAEDFEGNLLVIDEEGQTVKEIFKPKKNLIGSLSGDLVGFWKAETIKVAVELNLLDNLPGYLDELEAKSQVPQPNLERFLRALWEIGIVEKRDDLWILTEKGNLLTPKVQSFMASASLMWPQVQKEWPKLKEKLMLKEIHHHPTFKEGARDEKSLEIYRRALKGYVQEDFFDISIWPIWGTYSTLLGLGQTAIAVLENILKVHCVLKGIILNENRPLYHVNLDDSIKPRMQQVFQELDKPWDVKADAVLLPRFLHYFPDEQASQILSYVYKVLPPKGTLYLFEMILDPLSPRGGLLDLNMLVESGGGLRTLSQWKQLLTKTGFLIQNDQPLKPHLHLIVGRKS
jgi:hypothetical protein